MMDRHMRDSLDRYITGNWGEDLMAEYEDARHSRLIHSARHLTGREMDRLLHRYDLDGHTRRILSYHESEEASYSFECWSEQLAERGCATRYYTRMEQHHRMHPVYGPEPAPRSWRETEGDDIPF